MNGNKHFLREANCYFRNKVRRIRVGEVCIVYCYVIATGQHYFGHVFSKDPETGKRIAYKKVEVIAERRSKMPYADVVEWGCAVFETEE